jgi:ABC-2 type transport system permease protein
MDPRRVRSVARRIAAQFRHDRRSLGLLIVAPIVVLSLVGALWGRTDTTRTRLTVATDGLPAAQVEQVLAPLRAAGTLDVDAAETAEAMARLREGRTDAVFRFRQFPVTLVVEGSDPLRTPATLQAIQTALLGPSGTGAARGFQVEYLYGAGYTLLDHLAPLLIGLFAFFFTFLLAAVSFLRERTSGTLERLMATPLRRGELVLGYLAGFSFFALVQAVVIIAFTVLVLRVKYTGNVGTIFLIEAMLVIVSVSLGLFVSAFARNELQAIQFIPIVLVPQIFLSGLLVPVDQLPDVLRPLSVLMPLTYSNEALRAVMIRGIPLDDPLIIRDLLVLAAFGVVTIFGAIASIRREVA